MLQAAAPQVMRKGKPGPASGKGLPIRQGNSWPSSQGLAHPPRTTVGLHVKGLLIHDGNS